MDFESDRDSNDPSRPWKSPDAKEWILKFLDELNDLKFVYEPSF